MKAALLLQLRKFWPLAGVAFGWFLAAHFESENSPAGRSKIAPSKSDLPAEQIAVNQTSPKHDPVSNGSAGFSSHDSPLRYRDHLKAEAFAYDLQVTEKIQFTLGLSESETIEINRIIGELRENVNTLELENLEVIEQHDDRLEVVVGKFANEGEQIFKNARGLVELAIGEDKTDILYTNGQKKLRAQLRGLGSSSQRFLFMPNTNSGYRAFRVYDGGWEDIFPGTTDIPSKYEHLFGRQTTDDDVR